MDPWSPTSGSMSALRGRSHSWLPYMLATDSWLKIPPPATTPRDRVPRDATSVQVHVRPEPGGRRRQAVEAAAALHGARRTAERAVARDDDVLPREVGD